MDKETLVKVIAELNDVIDMIERKDKIEAMFGAIVARDAVCDMLDSLSH